MKTQKITSLKKFVLFHKRFTYERPWPAELMKTVLVPCPIKLSQTLFAGCVPMTQEPRARKEARQGTPFSTRNARPDLVPWGGFRLLRAGVCLKVISQGPRRGRLGTPAALAVLCLSLRNVSLSRLLAGLAYLHDA